MAKDCCKCHLESFSKFGSNGQLTQNLVEYRRKFALLPEEKIAFQNPLVLLLNNFEIRWENVVASLTWSNFQYSGQSFKKLKILWNKEERLLYYLKLQLLLKFLWFRFFFNFEIYWDNFFAKHCCKSPLE